MNKENLLLLIRANKKKPLLLDGAIGSFLQTSGHLIDKHLWSSRLNIEQPELIIKLHSDYINAGADIITTNTFRTNPLAKKKSDLSITNVEFVNRSVQLAKDISIKRKVIIAGSNAPAEDCYQNERTISAFDLEYNHKKHIELLFNAGVDIIWNETHSHLDEIEIISRFCSENKIPFVMNLFCDANLKLLSGQHLNEVVEIISAYSPAGIGINCIKPELFKKYILLNTQNNINGFYLNCGLEEFGEGTFKCSINPEDYFLQIKDFLTEELLYIGSCCGSSPLHTKMLREKIDEIY